MRKYLHPRVVESITLASNVGLIIPRVHRQTQKFACPSKVFRLANQNGHAWDSAIRCARGIRGGRVGVGRRPVLPQHGNHGIAGIRSGGMGVRNATGLKGMLGVDPVTIHQGSRLNGGLAAIAQNT